MQTIAYCIEPACNNIVSDQTRRCLSCAGKAKWSNEKYRKAMKKRLKNVKHKSRLDEILTKVFLNKEYVKNIKSIHIIARAVNCSSLAVFWRVKEFGFLRTKSESAKKGKEHRYWTGGNPDYGVEFTNELKEKIRQRDNYTCQLCGIKQKYHFVGHQFQKLIVHHIDTNKRNNSGDNLISLCRRCRTKIHHNISSNWEVATRINKIAAQ